MKNPIYLDYNSTTPLATCVLEAMDPFQQLHFGNPSSSGHSFGWRADMAIQKAKKQISECLGCQPNELFFTSGATESNNWVIFGLLHDFKKKSPNEKIHFITSCVEHKSVLSPMMEASVWGAEVTVLPVNKYGQVELETFIKAIQPNTKLASIMWSNNEIGSYNPIEQIGKICREKQIYFHTDATQVIGKIPVELKNSNIDLMTFSGHKIYGPKGIGALYVRQKNPRVEISPLIFGGGQQSAMRAGTLNVCGIVGLAEATQYITQKTNIEHQRLLQFRQKICQALQNNSRISINGHPTEVMANTLSLSFAGIPHDQLIHKLQPLAVSAMSACGSGSFEQSHVLKAIGLSVETSQNTIRLSMGHSTTESEVLEIIKVLTSLYAEPSITSVIS